jgi:ABC-type multidrug transport system ATPase subunit
VGENGLSSTTWAIEAYGLAKSFGNTRALAGIDLKVKKGDHLTIFGPNGAGKTTLIKLLSTLTKPSGGSALLDGLDIREAPGQIRSRLGVVSHSTFLYNNLTVSENLRFYGRMYGVANLEQRIREVISQVQLESRLHDQVGTLSRGMKQRVAIARAVLHDPLERGIEFADQVVILHEGRVAYQASGQEIDTAGFRETYDRCIGMSI